MRYSKDFKNIHALCKALDMNRSAVYHRDRRAPEKTLVELDDDELMPMRFNAMAAELERQMQDPTTYVRMGFEERGALMVDAEWNIPRATSYCGASGMPGSSNPVRWLWIPDNR